MKRIVGCMQVCKEIWNIYINLPRPPSPGGGGGAADAISTQTTHTLTLTHHPAHYVTVSLAETDLSITVIHNVRISAITVTTVH
jgi:hypothetical protein